MITVRKSKDRGYADHGWLKSYHTFSFADYYDPSHMQFKTLRVINEDYVDGGQGFGEHPHRDMEIVTFVISGALLHKDSLGYSDTIQPGQIQRMTAGKGILHSEFNASETEQVHLLQIWIMPNQTRLVPGYETVNYIEAPNGLSLLVSPDGGENTAMIHQEAEIYLGMLDSGKALKFSPQQNSAVWLQVIEGDGEVNGENFTAGDGVSAENENELTISAKSNTRFLLFRLG